MGKKLHPSDAVYERHIGNYVILDLRGSHSTIGGKFIGIEDGHAILNPSQGTKWDSTKGGKRVLIRKDRTTRLEDVVDIMPTTRKDILNYCTYMNSQVEKSNNKNSKEPNN